MLSWANWCDSLKQSPLLQLLHGMKDSVADLDFDMHVQPDSSGDTLHVIQYVDTWHHIYIRFCLFAVILTSERLKRLFAPLEHGYEDLCPLSHKSISEVRVRVRGNDIRSQVSVLVHPLCSLCLRLVLCVSHSSSSTPAQGYWKVGTDLDL